MIKNMRINSAIPPKNPSYWTLDKDKKCIEKTLNCSETYDKNDCLKIAKASENNKRCTYDKKYYIGTI
jgi:hypothetical protein